MDIPTFENWNTFLHKKVYSVLVSSWWFNTFLELYEFLIFCKLWLQNAYFIRRLQNCKSLLFIVIRKNCESSSGKLHNLSDKMLYLGIMLCFLLIYPYRLHKLCTQPWPVTYNLLFQQHVYTFLQSSGCGAFLLAELLLLYWMLANACISSFSKLYKYHKVNCHN
jgi:hypothetical protein